MASASATPDKKTWLIIFGAFVGSVFNYGLMCFFMTQARLKNPLSAPNPPTDVICWIIDALAILSLLAAISWMYVKMSGQIGGDPTYSLGKHKLIAPSEFQTRSVVALGIAEACVVLGLVLFYMGASIKDFVPFAVGTILVDVLYILPRGLKYWSSWEQQQKAEEQRTSSPFSQSL